MCHILELDKVYVRKDICITKVIAPHSKANVLLIRSLRKSLPIWRTFHIMLKHITTHNLPLKNLPSTKYPQNFPKTPNFKNSANSFGITDDGPFFPHPTHPNESIYWLYDPCHLIKLIRNHLLGKNLYS